MDIAINPESLLVYLYDNYTPDKYIELCHTSEEDFESVYSLCRQLKKESLIEYTVPFGGMILGGRDGKRREIPPSEGFLCARLTVLGWQTLETKNKNAAKQKSERRTKILEISIALVALILTGLSLLFAFR